MEAFDVSAMLREAAVVFRRANPHARGEDFAHLAHESYLLVVAGDKQPRERTDRPAQSAHRCRECGHLVRVHAAAGHCLADECECQMVDDTAPSAPPERPGEMLGHVCNQCLEGFHSFCGGRPSCACASCGPVPVPPTDVATERTEEIWTEEELRKAKETAKRYAPLFEDDPPADVAGQNDKEGTK